MAVRVLLKSGEWRVVPDADGARLGHSFFLITRRYHDGVETVLTLRAENVVRAEIERDGAVTEYVPGAPPDAPD